MTRTYRFGKHTIQIEHRSKGISISSTFLRDLGIWPEGDDVSISESLISSDKIRSRKNSHWEPVTQKRRPFGFWRNFGKLR